MAERRPRRIGAPRDEAPPAAAEGPAPVCSVGFCPFCLAVAAVGQARPEAVEHLLLAGREMLLAVRAVIDARLEGMEAPARLERITIE